MGLAYVVLDNHIIRPSASRPSGYKPSNQDWKWVILPIFCSEQRNSSADLCVLFCATESARVTKLRRRRSAKKAIKVLTRNKAPYQKSRLAFLIVFSATVLLHRLSRFPIFLFCFCLWRKRRIGGEKTLRLLIKGGRVERTFLSVCLSPCFAVLVDCFLVIVSYLSAYP